MTNIDKVPTPDYYARTDVAVTELLSQLSCPTIETLKTVILKEIEERKKRQLEIEKLFSLFGPNFGTKRRNENERQQRTTDEAGTKSDAKRGKRARGAKGKKRKQHNRVAKKRV